jgi:colanic acid biosynthesis glycosyl transferase WcaI
MSRSLQPAAFPAGDPMRLVFLNQYYPPDTAPTGMVLRDVCERLTADGHEVTVLCGPGGYAGENAPAGDVRPMPGLRILRLPCTRFGRRGFLGKLADYASFYFGTAWKIATLRPAPERIIALTTPPYLSLLARFFSKLRGADHAHWIMDLYPDVMTAHGWPARGSAPDRLLQFLTRWGFGGRRMRQLVTLGPDMAAACQKHLPPSTHAHWTPLWGLTDDASPPLPPEPGPTEPLILMYSGNMGLGHRFREFLSAAVRHGDACHWRFHGGGKRRPEIESFLQSKPGAPILLADPVPSAALASHLATAHIHLVSLEPSWTGTMVPSKLQGIFAIGRPALFIGDAESSIGRWILESDGGWVVPPNTPAALDAALAEARAPGVLRKKSENALEYARRHFHRPTNASRVAEWLSAP